MKRLALVTVSSLILNACGSNSSGTSEQSITNEQDNAQYAQLVPSMDGLPTCSESKKHTLVYVTEENKFAKCTGTTWELIEIKGDKGSKGDKGDKGEKGDTGVAGENGKDGKDGEAGKSGLNILSINKIFFDPFSKICNGIDGDDVCRLDNVQLTIFNNDTAFLTLNIIERDFSSNNEISNNYTQWVYTNKTQDFVTPLDYTFDVDNQLVCYWFEWKNSTQKASIYTTEDCSDFESPKLITQGHKQ